MYRRVLVPIALAIGVQLAAGSLGIVWAAWGRRALDSLHRGTPIHWVPPELPTGNWLLFLVVFLAVRLCAQRGGSRRECITVGLSPLGLVAIPSLYLIASSGLSSLLFLLGSVGPIRDGSLSLGTAVMVRTMAATLLGVAAACVGATWLWFFVSRQGAKMGTGSTA